MDPIERKTKAAAHKAYDMFIAPTQSLDEMAILFAGFVKIVARDNPQKINSYLKELKEKARKDPNVPSLSWGRVLMHPADIQAALKKRGITQKQIARELGVSEFHISDVINKPEWRRSERAMRYIAERIELPPEVVFPCCFPPAAPVPPQEENEGSWVVNEP